MAEALAATIWTAPLYMPVPQLKPNAVPADGAPRSMTTSPPRGSDFSRFLDGITNRLAQPRSPPTCRETLVGMPALACTTVGLNGVWPPSESP